MKSLWYKNKAGWAIGLLLLAVVSIWIPAPSNNEIYRHRMDTKISNFHGDAGVYVVDLYNKNGYTHKEREIFPAASCIKLPVVIELYLQSQEGKIDLDKKVILGKDKIADGSGILSKMDPDNPISIRDLAKLMIITSDCSAYDYLLDLVGMDNVNQRMKTLGLRNTRVLGKVAYLANPTAISNNTTWGIGYTTPEDMGILLSKIAKREIGDDKSSAEIENMLCDGFNNSRIPRYIDNNRVAHKTGSLLHSFNDVGLVRKYQHTIIICILTKNVKIDQRLTIDCEPELFIASLAGISYRYLSK